MGWHLRLHLNTIRPYDPEERLTFVVRRTECGRHFGNAASNRCAQDERIA